MAKITDLPELDLDDVDGEETLPVVKGEAMVRVPAMSLVEKLAKPFSDSAQDWAEGNAPGGPGTKSAKQVADELAASTALIGSAIQPGAPELLTPSQREQVSTVSFIKRRRDLFYAGKRLLNGVVDSSRRLAFGVAENGDIYAPRLIFGARQKAQIDERVPSQVAAAIPYLRRARNLFYNGKRLLAGHFDANRRLAIGVAEDGTVYIPKLAFTAALLASVSAIVSASTAPLELAYKTYKPPVTALDAIALAGIRPIDFVGIGDSNHLKDGYGYWSAWAKHLYGKYGMYASALYATNHGYIGVGQNSGTGGGGSAVGTSIVGAGALEGYALPPLPGAAGGATPNGNNTYGYVADGATATMGSQNTAILLQGAAAGVDVTASWRCWYAHATFTSGAGSFSPSVRIEQSPYTSVLPAQAKSTRAETVGLKLDSVTIPADAGRAGKPVAFKWTPQGSNIVGPFMGIYARAENVAKKAGISCHALYGVGGQSLYDMAYQLTAGDTEPTKGWSRQQLINYFAEIRRLQIARGFKPIVVVYVNSGLNDQNETLQPSMGYRASTSPQGAEAWIDNADAIIKRLHDVWATAGWDSSELYFLFQSSHPTANPDAAKLVSYRKVASAYFENRARTSFIDVSNRISADRMLAEGWYMENGTDRYHLTGPTTGSTTVTGYDGVVAALAPLIPTL